MLTLPTPPKSTSSLPPPTPAPRAHLEQITALHAWAAGLGTNKACKVCAVECLLELVGLDGLAVRVRSCVGVACEVLCGCCRLRKRMQQHTCTLVRRGKAQSSNSMTQPPRAFMAPYNAINHSNANTPQISKTTTRTQQLKTPTQFHHTSCSAPAAPAA